MDFYHFFIIVSLILVWYMTVHFYQRAVESERHRTGIGESFDKHLMSR